MGQTWAQKIRLKFGGDEYVCISMAMIIEWGG